MGKLMIYSILVIVLLIAGGYLLLGKSSVNGNVIADDTGGNFQKVVLGTKNLNYYPNTVTVRANEPVRIYLDETVTGCLRSFTIRDFGIAKNLPTPNDYVQFTPTKPGTYGFACSMGMGTGTLIVE
ncbi:MAG: cupredoxin domain-containing protein [Candidatus Pacearchaeota archaeon]